MSYDNLKLGVPYLQKANLV